MTKTISIDTGFNNPLEHQLRDAGYTWYPDPINHSLRGCSRKFDDEQGTKYFITCNHYNLKKQGVADDNTERYTFRTQFRINKAGQDQVVDINFSADFLDNEYRPVTTLAEVEEFFERMFVSTGADYYELS